MKKLAISFAFFFALFSCMGQTDSINSLLKQAEDALSRGQYLPAYQFYKQVVSLNNQHPEALKGMAETANTLKYYAIARESYKSYLSIKSNDTGAIRQLVQLNFNTRQWNDAIDMGKKAKALGIPGNHDLIIAKSYYELEEYGSAVVYIEKAWRIDSTRPELPFLAARSFVEMNNYRRAAGCYEQALRLSPDNEVWMYEAAMTYSAIPDETKAVEWFEKAIGHGYPRRKDVLENMAVSYLGVKAYDKCLSLVNEVLASKPQDLELLFMAGEANFRMGRHEEAIAQWDKMLAIDKNQARAIYMIGVAYIRKGEEAKGQQLCEKAISMDPALADLRKQRSQFGL